jgi:hypothetical protein
MIARDDALRAKRDMDDSTDGALDAQAGKIDADRVRKSLSYGSSVTLQRAKLDWNIARETLTDDIKAAIYSDTDPDPAKREERISKIIDDSFRKFALGDDGKVKYEGFPAAQKWLANEMATLRSTAGAEAYKMIEDRMGDESVTQGGEVLAASIAAGQQMELWELYDNLLPTVNRSMARQAFIVVAKDSAASLADKAVELFETDPKAAQELAEKALQVTRRLRNPERPNPAGAHLHGLLPNELYDISFFERGLRSRLKDAKQAGLVKRQSEAGYGFLARMNGLGTPVTESELRGAAERGDISIPMLDTLLSNKEADARAARAEVRADQAASRDAEMLDKERDVDDYVASILSPVASGTATPSAAKAKLLEVMATIPDRETRNAIVYEVNRSIDTIVDLRKASRPHAQAVRDFREWSVTYKEGLRRATLPKGVTLRQAEQRIDDWINDWMVQLALGSVDPSRIRDFMSRAENWLDDHVLRRFPPRGAAK